MREGSSWQAQRAAVRTARKLGRSIKLKRARRPRRPWRSVPPRQELRRPRAARIRQRPIAAPSGRVGKASASRTRSNVSNSSALRALLFGLIRRFERASVERNVTGARLTPRRRGLCAGRLSHVEPLIGRFAPHLDFSEGYSAYTPAALITAPQRSISDLTKARRKSGLARSGPAATAPRSANLDLTSGSFKASFSAATNLSITGFGVPLGANMAYQMFTSKPGNPAPAAVGRFGSASARVGLVTA